MEKILFQNAVCLDVVNKKLRQVDIEVTGGSISALGTFTHTRYDRTVDLGDQGILVPGFIDAHLHFESSMVLPGEMLKEALKRGTITYIADPHEAANVSGLDGIQLLLDATEELPGNIYFMLPSCVPALENGENGATLDAQALKMFADHNRVLGLGEVMDVPSVINGNPAMLQKLSLFKNKIIDGHAPLLTGESLRKYVAREIVNDHECTTAAEVIEKVGSGMHIHAREGSAAHNLREIMTAAVQNNLPWESFSFCTDDRSIKDIRQIGYIDHAIRLAVKCGVPAIEAILMASYYTAKHYKIDHIVGVIEPGRQADWVLLDNLDSLQVKRTYCRGNEFTSMPERKFSVPARFYHTMHAPEITPEMLKLHYDNPRQPTIKLVPDQILTQKDWADLPLDENGNFIANQTYNKAVVLERHKNTGHFGVGVVRGFELKNAAIASSVAHDDHNICAIGDNDEDICAAVNHLRAIGGGYVMASQGKIIVSVPLPVLGLMSDKSYDEVSYSLNRLHMMATRFGVPEGILPTVTLSFLALAVIPEFRLTTHGYAEC